MNEIYFAGGCFWGVEEYFSRIDGVVETMVGYGNGHTVNPSYEQVCSGTTGHVEMVKVVYDEEEIKLNNLLSKFWEIIDPTVLNRQGPDVGNQYRTGIYYKNDKDKDVIKKSLKVEAEKYTSRIYTEVEKLSSFYKAEEYHQDYLKKNPGGYCHIPL